MITIGLIEPISAYTGIGTGRCAARSKIALPPLNEPVKPTAAISGASTSRSPTSTPAAGRCANVASGSPASATAPLSSRATSAPVPGCDGWPLTITGQPAASADAVSPPAVENASGKLEAPNTATGPTGTRMRRTSGRGIGTASGSGEVDDRLGVVTRLDDRRERLELPARALELRAQACLGQPGLGLADGHDLVAGRAQPRGGAAQQGDALGPIAQRAGAVHGGRGRRRGAHVVGRRLLEARAGLAGAGIDGVERERHDVYLTAGPKTEPMRSVQTHARSRAIKPRQRYEDVADRLAADIRAGRLAPGERLPSERDLARQLEVGRASVREAIAALQVAGMIETRPGAGSFVAAGAAERSRETHDSSPSDLLEARALLEPTVARLAAQRGGPDAEIEALLAAMENATGDGWNDCDRRFHQRIAALTGNPVLAGLADHIAAVMDEPLWQRLRDDSIAVPGRTTIHLAEHRMIYEAIAEGDADAAELYAAQHIRRVRKYMTLD